MRAPYPARALAALVLFGVLAAAMAVLASSLIFQLQAGRERGRPGAGAGAVPEGAAAVLLPLSAALAALCLVLNLSCLLLCLLHGYCSAELCRGDAEPDRADWFLLDSRTVRHVAVGLFCCGVSIYLTALAIYMLLLFEMETGITGACILSSGILVLLITVTHALVRAKQVARRGRTQLSHTLYENDSAQHSEVPARHLNNSKNVAVPRPRPEIHREFSYPPFLERKAPLASPASSTVSSAGSPGALPEGSCSLPRTHRTLSAESGLLQAQGKPWNGVTQEMKNVLARKPVAAGKDSTLV